MQASRRQTGRAFRIVLGLAALLAGAAPGAAAQWSFKVLHAFHGGLGSSPVSGMTMDGSGNLFGTTEWGGASGRGSVFKIAPDGRERVLYSFCSLADCGDGQSPIGGIVIGASGNLYGTTLYGAAYAPGTVFKVTP